MNHSSENNLNNQNNTGTSVPEQPQAVPVLELPADPVTGLAAGASVPGAVTATVPAMEEVSAPSAGASSEKKEDTAQQQAPFQAAASQEAELPRQKVQPEEPVNPFQEPPAPTAPPLPRWETAPAPQQGVYQRQESYASPPPNYVKNGIYPKQEVKRVGLFSMGVGLIVVGALVLYHMVNPSFDLVQASRYLPAILILLGGEVLLASFTGKNKKLKFDFLSGLFAFMLIVGSVGVTVAAPLYQRFGPARHNAEVQLEKEIYDQYYNACADLGLLSSLNVSLYLESYDPNNPPTVDNLKAVDDICIDGDLGSNYTKNDRMKFAEDCKAILDRISSRPDLAVSRLQLSSHENNEKPETVTFTLSVNDQFTLQLPVEKLAEMVDMTDHYTQADYLEELQETMDDVTPPEAYAYAGQDYGLSLEEVEKYISPLDGEASLSNLEIDDLRAQMDQLRALADNMELSDTVRGKVSSELDQFQGYLEQYQEIINSDDPVPGGRELSLAGLQDNFRAISTSLQETVQTAVEDEGYTEPLISLWTSVLEFVIRVNVALGTPNLG